ncbi:MAG: beta-galactosidase [Clostridiales bacterium]|jgi:beta-galactosidase|nr:beta-galactosidase [Clostridiales bacterium]
MRIQWTDRGYIIDNTPGFLVSGEFHYFRVPKTDWERRLVLLKEAGMNCVATYIPWEIHEQKEGEFLFGDVPERDLEGFLRLCAKMELAVLCRPGPYQYSELRYDGLPEWLCEGYPAIYAQNVQGNTFRNSAVSYLHPLFLEKVQRWYRAVCPIVAKYMSSRGGPITFVQADNEMMGICIWNSGGWDYNREAMGIGAEGGRYPAFLKDRYSSVQALNAAYQTNFASFSAVQPFAGEAHDATQRRRVKDYQDFYFATVAEYVVLLTGWMREHGIDCDIVHNSPNPASNPQFLEVVRRMGKGFLLGSDHYYNLGPGWEQNNPTPQYTAKSFLSSEMLRLMGFPPTVFELPGGSASDWPPITSQDLRCCYDVNLAFGMKGLNYYIFTGGKNPFQIGRFSDVYDYGASIGADGSIRPVYMAVKEFGAFLQEHAWLACAALRSDILIGLDWEMGRCASYYKTREGVGISGTEAWSFLREGLITTSLCCSYTPELADLTRLDSISTEKPLLIPTSACMAKALQAGVTAFLRRGGRVLLSPTIPYLDENFNPCTILSDYLGRPEIRPCMRHAPRFTVGNIENIAVNSVLFGCTRLPVGANVKTIAKEEHSAAVTGWRLDLAEGGSALWLGLAWDYCMKEHRDMFIRLLKELGAVEPVIESDNPNVWSVLRVHENRAMLFIMNPYSAPMEASLRVRSTQGSGVDIGKQSLKPMEVKALELRNQA